MFERLDDLALRVVARAREEARLLDHDYIGTEHLLLGVVQANDALTAEALSSRGISLEAVRVEVESQVGRGPTPASGHVPFNPSAKKALEVALRGALARRHSYIGVEDLLYAVISDRDGVAAQVLERLGVDLGRVRGWLTTSSEGRAHLRGMWAAMGPRVPRPMFMGGREPVCSFCGRDLWEVERYVESSSARICDQCVDAAKQAVDDAVAQEVSSAEPLRLPPRVFGAGATDEVIDAVTEAFVIGCSGGRPDDERAEHIEDGAVLVPLLRQTGARFAADIEAVVHAVRIAADGHAQVRFGILVNGMEVSFTGDAVHREGRWQVTRATVGALLARGGVQLPPKDDPS